MKRLLLTLALAVSLVSMSSFATGENLVSREALESFQKSFKSATNVTWSVSEIFYKASFSMNGIYASAYYTTDGKMIALTRNISSLQLPMTLQANLKQDYSKYWISDLFELANDEGTHYYITLEDGENRLVLKSNSSEWSVFIKQRKS